jgi:hypothetical protein
MAPGQLLLLTGPPGCGKTTVAPLVADRHDPSACLNLDWFFDKVRVGRIDPWQPESHQQNRVILGAAAASVAALVAGGYDTIGDGILFPFMLDLFTAACAPMAISINYAVLRAPLPVVLQRAQARLDEPEHARALADPAVVGDLWTTFDQLDVEQRHVVDVGTRTPDAVAGEIDRRWAAGDFDLRS